MSYVMHPELKFGEVKLKVSHLARSIAFYEEIVGFKLLKQEGNIATFTVDGEDVLLIIEEVPDAIVTPPRTTSGLYHFAILLPDRQALGVSLKRLVEKGVPFGQADHLVSEALYISDPDHNGIEIYRDRPREEWQVNADGTVTMATEPLDLNDIMEEAAGIEWHGLPLGTTIGHVHLHVNDLAKAEHFYHHIMGLDIMAHWHGALFVAAGGYHHHLGLNVWAGEGTKIAPQHGTGLDYYSFVLPDDEALNALINRLQQSDIEVVHEPQHERYMLKDSSGIHIALRRSNK